jgi:hypothetical protein
MCRLQSGIWNIFGVYRSYTEWKYHLLQFFDTSRFMHNWKQGENWNYKIKIKIKISESCYWILQFLKLVFVGSGILLVDVMWVDNWCWDVKVVLCHPAACVLFHRSACPVENTAVSKLLRLRFLHLRQVSGFHSGINNLHFLLFYDIMLGYRRFKRK